MQYFFLPSFHLSFVLHLNFCVCVILQESIYDSIFVVYIQGSLKSDKLLSSILTLPTTELIPLPPSILSWQYTTCQHLLLGVKLYSLSLISISFSSSIVQPRTPAVYLTDAIAHVFDAFIRLPLLRFPINIIIVIIITTIIECSTTTIL